MPPQRLGLALSMCPLLDMVLLDMPQPPEVKWRTGSPNGSNRRRFDAGGMRQCAIQVPGGPSHRDRFTRRLDY